MNFQEQLAAWIKKRADIVTKQNAIMESAATDDRTLTEDEETEFEGHATELAAVSKHVERLTSLVKDEAPTKSTVDFPAVHIKKTDPEDKFPGQSFVRKIIAKTVAHNSQGEFSMLAVAKSRWGKTHPQLVEVIAKTAVAGGGTGSGEWGAELVSADGRYTGDFIEFLYGLTVYDRLPLREVPAHVTIKGQDGAATGFWVGESAAIPASAQGFTDVTLTPLKVAAIAVISNELIEHSDPSAEMLVRDGIVNAAAARIDTTFISAGAASAGVSPAGILNGLTPVTPSGTDADAVRADINSLYAGFLTAKNASGLHIVTNKTIAKAISLQVNALGQSEFGGLTADGGTLAGDPVVTGDNVAAGDFVLLKPSDIYKIGSKGVNVSISKDATIEMDDAPTMESEGPTAATGALVGMFQTESTALKVVTPINFALRRAGSVAFVDAAAYVP